MEWFYPVTRLVKRGLYDPNMKSTKPDPGEKVYFYQEIQLDTSMPPTLILGRVTNRFRGGECTGLRRTAICSIAGSCLDPQVLIALWLVFPANFTYIQQSITYFRERIPLMDRGLWGNRASLRRWRNSTQG